MAPERVCALHPNPLPGGERELPVRFTGAALLFRFSTEPFFVDFVVSSVLAQGFQRAVDFVTQLVATFRERNTVLLCFQRVTYRFELTVTGGFDEVQNVWRIVQKRRLRGWCPVPYRRYRCSGTDADL
ncbi:Uncharacterised protein [Escherichia coli]|nr:Uncharacterised protein [Escherichia coli]